jgi:hypothetical protein
MVDRLSVLARGGRAILCITAKSDPLRSEMGSRAATTLCRRECPLSIFRLRNAAGPLPATPSHQPNGHFGSVPPESGLAAFHSLATFELDQHPMAGVDPQRTFCRRTPDVCSGPKGDILRSQPQPAKLRIHIRPNRLVELRWSNLLVGAVIGPRLSNLSLTALL